MPPGQKRTIPKSSPLLDEGNHARYILVVLYLVNSQIYFPYGCLMLVVSNYCCFIYSPNNMNIYEASCNSESDSLARTLPLKRGGPLPSYIQNVSKVAVSNRVDLAHH